MTALERKVDTIRRYGIEHFLNKYGPLLEPSNVKITYENAANQKGIVVRVQRNNIENKIKGYIVFRDDKIPIFEEPNQVYGKPMMEFSGKNRFICIALNNRTVLIGFDIFNEIGHILSGHLEKFWSDIGRTSESLIKIPIVDAYEKILFDCICNALKGVGAIPFNESLWPGGKKFAVCLSHDVDRIKKSYQYLTHFFKHLYRGNVTAAKYQIKSLLSKKKQKDLYWNFEELMNIETEFGKKSTFFFLNETARPRFYLPKTWFMFSGLYHINEPEIRDIIKKLRDLGWDIGLHASFYSHRSGKMLKKEKKALEGIIGREIHGVRQHFINLDIPETWKLQALASFDYDSSLGFRHEIGFRWGTCHPFFPFDTIGGKKLPILEIPLQGMDRSIVTKKNGWEECRRMVDTVKKYDGIVNLVWHQRVFNEDEFPNWSKTYIRLVRFCMENGAWITTLQEINDLYRNRIENIKVEDYIDSS